MKKLITFATQHPVIFSLIIFPLIPYASVALLLAFGKLTDSPTITISSVQSPGMIISVIIYLLIIWQFGWFKQTGLTSVGKVSGWMIMLAAALYEIVSIIFAITGKFHINYFVNIVDLDRYILVGVMEEIAFRGLILYVFIRLWGDTRQGIFRAVLVSSLFFGLGHLATIFSGNTLAGATFQMLSTLISGIFSAALYLYAESLWVVIVSHALTDVIIIINLLAVTDYTRANFLVFLVDLPLLLIGMYLIWKLSPRPVIPEVP